MKKRVNLLIVILFTFSLLAGCINNPPPPITKDTKDIYIAGQYSDDGLSAIACYWKNGVRFDLPGSNGAALDICISGSDVYVAGSYIKDGKITPCYWKNGERIDLPAISTDRAGSIFVSGPDIYISSTFGNAYWKNGVRYTPGLDEHWNSIYLHESDFYILGYYLGKPCYWKNGERTDLIIPNLGTDYAIGLGNIFVSGSDIYCSVTYQNGDDPWIIGYWKNGDLINYQVSLDPNISMFRLSSLFVDGLDIYMLVDYHIGSTPTPSSFLLKNGVKTDLSYRVTSLVVSDSSLYMSGYPQTELNPKPCYWKDGVQVNLSDELGITWDIEVK